MNYYCTSCSVQTKNKRNFDIHNSSLRHIQKTNSTSEDTKFKYICGCGKSFSNKPNLCRHSKKCVIRQEKSNANSSTVPSLCPTLFNTLVQQTQIMAETIQTMDSQIKALQTQQYTSQSPQINISQFKTKIPPKIRIQIREKQNNACGICEKDISQVFQLDHSIALQFGGTNNEDNLMALCCECHAKKSKYELKCRKEIKECIFGIIQKYIPELDDQ